MLTVPPDSRLSVRKLEGDTVAFVEGLYRRIDAVVSRSRSRCENCRRCCDFESAGHRLYVTNLELDYFFGKVAQVRRPAGDTCPYLDDEAGCTVRAIRPIGCRTYFCKPAEGYDAAELTERMVRCIKRRADRLGLEYRYVEWMAALTDLAKK